MQSTHDGLDELRPKDVNSNLDQATDWAQVVVVGAGLAGLAAAQRLHESGFEDVLVLEAQRRVGGRVHTIEHGDFLLELGAQWLHGAQDRKSVV